MSISRNLILAVAISSPLTVILATPGAIPLFEPMAATPITEPGVYVVTEAITAASGPVLRIDSSDVTIDLNGFAIRSLGITSSDSVIEIVPGNSRIEIKNGIIRGGYHGVYHSDSTATLAVELDNVTFDNNYHTPVFGRGLSRVAITNCTIDSPGQYGLYLDGGDSSFSGTIRDNTFRETTLEAISVIDMDSGVIESNVIGVHGIPGWVYNSAGIKLTTSNGCIVRGNSIGVGYDSDSGIVISSSYWMLIENNTVSDTLGIGIFLANGGGHTVRNNLVSGCGGEGIYVAAENNLIEANKLFQNNVGLYIPGSYGDTAYRNNMVRGNTTANILVSGSSNTDEGGNIQ